MGFFDFLKKSAEPAAPAAPAFPVTLAADAKVLVGNQGATAKSAAALSHNQRKGEFP